MLQLVKAHSCGKRREKGGLTNTGLLDNREDSVQELRDKAFDRLEDVAGGAEASREAGAGAGSGLDGSLEHRGDLLELGQHLVDQGALLIGGEGGGGDVAHSDVYYVAWLDPHKTS